MKIRAGAAPVLIALLFACASVDRNIEAVKRFQGLRESGDVRAAQEMLGADPRIWYEERSGEGRPWRLEGGDWGAWDEHFRSRKRWSDWRASRGEVTAIAWESNDYHELLERGPQPVRITWFLDREGRITGLLVSSVGMARSAGRREEFEAWARERRPEEYSALAPGGEIDPGGDHAARYRALLVEWRDAMGMQTREELRKGPDS